MAEKPTKMVLIYPPRVWKAIDPEFEAECLKDRGCEVIIGDAVITAIPPESIDPKDIFDAEMITKLEDGGVRIDFC